MILKAGQARKKCYERWNKMREDSFQVVFLQEHAAFQGFGEVAISPWKTFWEKEGNKFDVADFVYNFTWAN